MGHIIAASQCTIVENIYYCSYNWWFSYVALQEKIREGFEKKPCKLAVLAQPPLAPTYRRNLGPLKGRVQKNLWKIPLRRGVGGSATPNFPLRKIQQQHGLKTLDFAK